MKDINTIWYKYLFTIDMKLTWQFDDVKKDIYSIP